MVLADYKILVVYDIVSFDMEQSRRQEPSGKKMIRMQDAAGLSSILDPLPVPDMDFFRNNMTVNSIDEDAAMKEPRRKKQKNNGKHTSLVQIPSSIPDVLQQGDVQDDFNSGTSIQNVEPKSLQNTLDQIEQDVTQIMSSIAQKKPKVTLHQLNTKLDYIISILSNMNNCQLYVQ